MTGGGGGGGGLPWPASFGCVLLASSRRAPTRPPMPPYWAPTVQLPPRPTSRRRTGSRRSTPSATGPPPTCPLPASRSREAGSARTTSRATACSTRSSTAAGTSPGSARSACATSCCRTRRSTTAPRQEGALIAGGRSGLVAAFRSAHTTIYAVPSPRPIVTGPGPRRRARVRAAPDHGRARTPRPLPHRDELVAVLDDGRRLPLARRRRHRPADDDAGRRRAARPVGQCAGRSCGSGRRLEAAAALAERVVRRASPPTP